MIKCLIPFINLAGGWVTSATEPPGKFQNDDGPINTNLTSSRVRDLLRLDQIRVLSIYRNSPLRSAVHQWYR